MRKMTKDKTHNEQIERWAEFVRDNPNKWKLEHTKFINAQITIAQRFFKNLEKSAEGREILERIKESKRH